MKLRRSKNTGYSGKRTAGGALYGIYEDVAGAPFRIGQRVRVAAIIDETADIQFLGKEGRVAYFEYTCGCGQRFPDDPMIGVLFLDVTAEFWKEELETISHMSATSSSRSATLQSAN